MKPYFSDRFARLYNSDCRNMAELPDESVQMCVTSPPYWGLRKYAGLPDSIWGNVDHCEHAWGSLQAVKQGGQQDYSSSTLKRDGRTEEARLQTLARSSPLGEQPSSSGSVCSLCGAWRGQYGLEPSVDMYVQHTVEILREVRRVLRKDGVCFWNVGDSYASGGKSGEGETRTVSSKLHASTTDPSLNCQTRAPLSPGIPAKNLCLIPFRVALAAQQPYYTGRIKKIEDRIWLAAMIDSEGCIFIHKRKVGQSNGQGYERKHDTYGAGLEVANVHESIVKRCLEITGVGSICRVERETQTKKRNIPLYRWNLRSNECRSIVREVYPYLVGKQQEARLLLSCPPSGEQAEKAHYSLMELHNGRNANIDFPAPESMYEPGWYVRSVIVWSKKNPMPESVTDRPTESHEYIIMLTKSARYFWDAEAVRELESETSGGWQTRAKLGLPHHKTTYGTDVDSAFNGELRHHNDGLDAPVSTGGRNLRSVWDFPTQPYKEAHFATFPEALPERCIKAATPEVGSCARCGAPWLRVIRPTGHTNKREPSHSVYSCETKVDSTGWAPTTAATNEWKPSCKCGTDEKVPAVVLDCFAGSGTTGWVAKKLGRRSVLYELSEEYCKLIVDRNRQGGLL